MLIISNLYHNTALIARTLAITIVIMMVMEGTCAHHHHDNAIMYMYKYAFKFIPYLVKFRVVGIIITIAL